MDTQVLIMGAGTAGMTLAGLLASKGVACIVIDTYKDDRKEPACLDPRALAVTLASRRILESFGPWQKIPRDRSGLIRAMHVWDENGQGEIQFDSAELCTSALGYIVEQSVLQKSLDEVLNDLPSLQIQRGEIPQALHWTDAGISVELEQKSLSGKLLVAADGANSSMRNLAGIDHVIHDYKQMALACVVRTDLPHDQVARQRFLTTGPLAFLPMADAHQCGIVWSTTPQQSQHLLAVEAEEFQQLLEDAFEGALGEIKESGPRVVFPLQRAQAQRYCLNRFALIGDAAHSVHPLAGQGANLGILDAASLAQVLFEALEKGKDIGNLNILRRYERWRREENRIMMMIMEGFKYVFENQTHPLPLLRNAGLDLVDAMAPVKHWIMKRAMGFAGDLPDSARTGI